MSSVSIPIYVSPLQTTKAKRREKKLFVDKKKGYKEKRNRVNLEIVRVEVT